jgi:hypothetical protein
MAGATRTTFDAILKEFYIGSVIEQLNNEVIALEMFEKAIVDWNGKKAIIPVHVARNSMNSTAQFVPESGTLPTAGNQGYARLEVTAKYQYGRFQITGPAIASAKNGGKGAFIGYTDAEMNKLVSDVRNTANRVSMTGGACIGYIYEKTDIASTANAQVKGGAGGTGFGTTTFAFRGDYTVLNAVAATGAMSSSGNTDYWCPVDLVRMDTYNKVGTNQAGTSNVNFFVSEFNSAAGTVGITLGTNQGSINKAILKEVGALPGVKKGTAVAVVIRQAQAVDKDGAALGVNMSAFDATKGYTFWAEEPVGVQGNLSLTTHFGVTRNVKDPLAGASAAAGAVAADGTAPPLRSWVFAADKDSATNTSGAALALDRIQHCIDSVQVDEPTLSGGGDGRIGGAHEVDVMLMHPRQRQQYIKKLQGTIAMRINAGQGGGPTRKGDAGFLDVSYGDIPIKVSRAVPNGSIFFLRKSTWNLAELEKGKFADLDGAVLSRVSGSDMWEGFYRWYWNLVCKQPNCNAVLTGLELA